MHFSLIFITLVSAKRTRVNSFNKLRFVILLKRRIFCRGNHDTNQKRIKIRIRISSKLKIRISLGISSGITNQNQNLFEGSESESGIRIMTQIKNQQRPLKMSDIFLARAKSCNFELDIHP